MSVIVIPSRLLCVERIVANTFRWTSSHIALDDRLHLDLDIPPAELVQLTRQWMTSRSWEATGTTRAAEFEEQALQADGGVKWWMMVAEMIQTRGSAVLTRAPSLLRLQ